jgi:hypothetical protein
VRGTDLVDAHSLGSEPFDVGDQSGIVLARPPQPLALRLGPLQAGLNPLDDDGALELGEDAHHLEQRFAGGRAGVDALLMHVQLAALRVDFAQNSKEVLK